MIGAPRARVNRHRGADARPAAATWRSVTARGQRHAAAVVAASASQPRDRRSLSSPSPWRRFVAVPRTLTRARAEIHRLRYSGTWPARRRSWCTPRASRRSRPRRVGLRTPGIRTSRRTSEVGYSRSARPRGSRGRPLNQTRNSTEPSGLGQAGRRCRHMQRHGGSRGVRVSRDERLVNRPMFVDRPARILGIVDGAIGPHAEQ